MPHDTSCQEPQCKPTCCVIFWGKGGWEAHLYCPTLSGTLGGLTAYPLESLPKELVCIWWQNMAITQTIDLKEWEHPIMQEIKKWFCDEQ